MPFLFSATESLLFVGRGSEEVEGEANRCGNEANERGNEDWAGSTLVSTIAL